jgi:2-polyprenyl-6-methoxyphenol hydroxylase-like FAD-dependent oxidoreductase
VTDRYDHLLGSMRLTGTRHAYPLVAAYASRFVAERFALVGDAAVGMHPVTAHGFNFGLIGQQTLAGLIAGAAAAGRDIGGAVLLRRYQAVHRRATRPLYLTTNTTALLFADDRLPARVLRDVVIRAGERLPPLRDAVVAKLMQGSGRRSRPSLLRALVP